MEGEGGNKEQDGVGDRNWEPGQESGAGVSGTSRKERLKALHQPLCAPGSSVEKTKSTCLEWRVKFPRKEQCLMLEFSELLLSQPHHHGYRKKIGQFSHANGKHFFLISLDLSFWILL